MKKQSFSFSLLPLSLASFALSTAAFAQTQQNPLVTLTGNLDPEYSVKVSEQDLAQIAAGLKSIQTMQAISVDVNSIYSENDKAAFESAFQEVTRILVDATKHLVDMRAIVYKLDIDLQRDSQNRFTQKIYEAYQGHFQKRFTKLIETFLGENASLKTALGDAMERCYTTPCLQDIADAQMDMIEFGRAINHRINLDSSRLMESSYQGFRSRLVKDAVQKTVDAFMQTNKTNSLYVQLLRTAAGPFVSAASGLKNSVSEMANFIASPTQSRFKIYADPIQKKNREWKIAQEQFEARVGENYKEIIENGYGTKSVKPIAGMTFVKIPSRTASFTMGALKSEDRHQSDEAQHQVTFTYSFEMQTTPITQAQWQEVMGSNPSEFKGANHPVERISWEDLCGKTSSNNPWDCGSTEGFIKKMNDRKDGCTYRLPTEAEWEFAARGRTTTPYWFGDASKINDFAWYDSTSESKTHEVGICPKGSGCANAYGLYDMAGNVYQWVSDWYGSYSGSTTYHVDSNQGPSSGTYRVLRGGSWHNDAQNIRSAYRYDAVSDLRNNAIGARLVRKCR